MPQRKCIVLTTVLGQAQTHACDPCGWVEVGREGIHTVASETRLHIDDDECKPIHAFAFVVFHFLYIFFFSFNIISIHLHATCTERHAVIVIMNQQTIAAEYVCVCECAAHGCVGMRASTRTNSSIGWAFVLWFLDCRYTLLASRGWLFFSVRRF